MAMEVSVSLCQNLRSSSQPPSIPRQILHPQRREAAVLVLTRGKATRPLGLAVGCANLGAAAAAEEEEREIEEAAAEWVRAGRLGEKCGGEGRGLVEVLECLEREAIMGEDEGREPNDYNRRAQIFDKSSRVFQALKERNTTASASTGNDTES